jgi:hypothetical protein
VVVSEADGLEECKDVGGAIVEVATKPETEKEVCNGKEGEKGAEGDPWTAGGTLPPGATETGVWSFKANGESGLEVYAPFSFPIPLPNESFAVHFQEQENFGATCKGNINLPTAPSGHVCVYLTQAGLENAKFEFTTDISLGAFEGVGRTGGMLVFLATGTPASGRGTVAVTGM